MVEPKCSRKRFHVTKVSVDKTAVVSLYQHYTNSTLTSGINDKGWETWVLSLLEPKYPLSLVIILTTIAGTSSESKSRCCWWRYLCIFVKHLNVFCCSDESCWVSSGSFPQSIILSLSHSATIETIVLTSYNGEELQKTQEKSCYCTPSQLLQSFLSSSVYLIWTIWFIF